MKERKQKNAWAGSSGSGAASQGDLVLTETGPVPTGCRPPWGWGDDSDRYQDPRHSEGLLPHSPPISQGYICLAGTAWGCQPLLQRHSELELRQAGHWMLGLRVLGKPSSAPSGQGQPSHLLAVTNLTTLIGP